VPQIDAASDQDHIIAVERCDVSADPRDVWSGAYVAVWHLSGDLRDSTHNQHDGVDNMTASAPGRVAGGRAFTPATEGFVRTPDSMVYDTIDQLTISSWGYRRSDPQPGAAYALIARTDERIFDSNDFWLGYQQDTPRIGLSALRVDGSPMSLDVWTHMAATYDRTTLRLYIDGELVGATSATAPIHRTMDSVLLGGDHFGGGVYGDWIDGLIDEARIERVARSEDWIRADFASQTGTFTIVD
jgi:hypothetical protein